MTVWTIYRIKQKIHLLYLVLLTGIWSRFYLFTVIFIPKSPVFIYNGKPVWRYERYTAWNKIYIYPTQYLLTGIRDCFF